MAELPDVDVAIAGGGPVGCALALAMADGPLSVIRISDEATIADRPIALSYGSRLILERLGAWNSIPNSPIETIHISQQGFGRTVMRSADYDLPALGYVTAYSKLLAQLENRTPVVAGTLSSWESADKEVALRLSRGGEEFAMRARLLVLADGGQVHRAQNVRDYRQHALVAEVTAERPRRGIAWERFTAEGPLALLPHADRYALVWSLRPDGARELLGLSDRDFLVRLRETFGGRLGDFRSVSRRATFPLSLRRGPLNPAPRALAVGNAAQTLHPVAGQGLNLGLRDAWELAQMLLDVPKEEIGAPAFLAGYARERRVDRYAGIGFTDFLVRTFSNSILPLALLRGAGLAALDILPPARRFLARRMMFGARALP
ncbi:MAG TPA: FAD-dependent monooxygenase [Burkholderiales bacterium]